MSKRLVVVGLEHKFDQWLRTLPPEQRQTVVPIRDWQSMLGFRFATVQFMKDWRENRSAEEVERILEHARSIEEMKERMRDPFSHRSGWGG